MLRPLALLILALLIVPGAKAQDTIRLARYAGNLKQVTVRIGDSSYRLLFDTGGGDTFLSPRIAAALGKPVYGEATTFRMSGEPVRYQRCDSVRAQIGGRAYFFPSVGVWDLMSILPKGLPPIDGVLSLRSFAGAAISIDLAQELLIVETRASLRRRTQKMTLLGSRFATGPAGNELSVFLQLLHGGRPFWFLFDSGNLRDVLLSPATAKAWNINADSAGHVPGPVPLSLGGRSFTESAGVEPIIYDGALNFRFLSSRVFTLDLARYRVWMN
ncbi:MAG: hypothetical protein EOO11_02020 [Chitinophagaceae bacterium]|nr:MAG: hypothetical protein EOO11_02020 [Chitinophagaceae bacterium]